jgi:signal transduction histidine kinase
MILINEIDQPMIPIMNYCDLLQNRNIGEISAIQRKFLERISNSARQIRKLTNQFEENFQKHVLPISIEEDEKINISKLLNRMIQTKSKLLEQKQITLQLSVSDRIPEFMGNEKKLEGIIDFVLSNALTVSPSESIVKIIANTLNIYKERVVQIIVKDGGPGIVLKDLDKLMQENEYPEQIHPGLSIPHSHLLILNQLITEQKGTLNIRNGLDFGAIFEINLPLKQS